MRTDRSVFEGEYNGWTVVGYELGYLFTLDGALLSEAMRTTVRKRGMNKMALIGRTRRNDWIISSPFSRVSYPSGPTDLANVLPCQHGEVQPFHVGCPLIFHPNALKQGVPTVPRHLVI